MHLRKYQSSILFSVAAAALALVAPLRSPKAAAEPAPLSPAPATLRGSPRSDRPAKARDARKIIIARDRRMLWLVEGADTLLEAPIAVGSGDTLSFGKQFWRFATPKGTRTVLAKEADPVWIPPLWHFVERAREAGSPLVDLGAQGTYEFPDGSRVLVRNGIVGHLLPQGAFIPFEPGVEVIVNGIYFVPPLGSKNRRVRGELGAFKLDMGNGYLIHGTPHKDSIGKAATHGCIRVGDKALEFLFRNVPVGTRVHIT